MQNTKAKRHIGSWRRSIFTFAIGTTAPLHAARTQMRVVLAILYRTRATIGQCGTAALGCLPTAAKGGRCTAEGGCATFLADTSFRAACGVSFARAIALVILVLELGGAACAIASAEEQKQPAADAGRKTAVAEFKRADADGDGRLTLAEFLAPRPEANRQDDLRRFLVFDFDASGGLDAEEYRAIGAPVDERGDVPDPIVDIETAALAKWEAIFAAADGNQDGALSRQEWPAKQIAADIPALAELSFDHWDRGSDGKVDRADGRWLLDVAYGLTQLDGRPLRTKTGRVFSWYYFRYLDAGDDGLVSEYEFGIRHNQGKEKNAEIFARLDANGDGQLTDRETWSLLWHDTIGQFLDYDREQDGYLTADEMEAIGWGRSIARQCVGAFDNDRDGRLSFREFRQTTFANQTSPWPIRHDTDRDGRLSWKEFYTEKPPLLIGQYRYMFDRFDRNHDGFLSMLEFTIEGDAQQAHFLRFVEPLQRRLPLEVELARKVCELSDEQAAALETAGHDAFERIAKKLAAGRGNNGMWQVVQNGQAMLVPPGGDPQLVRAPYAVVRRDLSEALQVRSGKRGASSHDAAAWRDVWKRYAAERARIDERRAGAALQAYVAALDEVLLLSSRQRRELLELISSNSKNGWWQPARYGGSLNTPLETLLRSVAHESLGGFVVPATDLHGPLGDEQTATLGELRQPETHEVVFVQQVAAKPAGGAQPAADGAQGLFAGMQRGAQPIRRHVRQGPPLEDVKRRLTEYIAARVDQIDAACGLSAAQRDKLRLAGQLDIGALCDRLSSPPEKLAADEELVVRRVKVNGVTTPLPLQVFADADSYFRRSLEGRLLDEQRRRLAASERERGAFQRQALVHAIVAGFEAAASLTADQYDALMAALNAELADDLSESPEWRHECLQRIAQLPIERMRPLFFDFQWPHVQQQQSQLGLIAQQVAGQNANQALIAPAAAGGGNVLIRQ